MNSCEYCSKEFSNKYTLKNHKKSAKFCLQKQNNEADEKYDCSSCHRSFNRKHHLEVHQDKCIQYKLYQTEQKYKKNKNMLVK